MKYITTIYVKLVIVALIVLMLTTHTKAQSVTNYLPKLLPQYEATSNLFKLKVGLNRLVEFEKLATLIKPQTPQIEAAPDYEYFIGDYITTEAEIITLLGEPDLKISNTIYQYNLGTNSSACKVYIGISADGFVTYSVIKSCN